MSLNESTVEDAALTWFRELGYGIGHGPHMAPSKPAAAWDSFGEVVSVRRLREPIWWRHPIIKSRILATMCGTLLATLSSGELNMARVMETSHA